MTWTLADVQYAVRMSWGKDTCDPSDWHEDNPSRGQCGPTALVGGEVVQRPPGPPKRCREEYELLRTRVLARLRA